MASWGNEAGTPYEQDMQSPAGNYNLEVTDIDAARSALKATNSNANGLALDVSGKTLLDGKVTIEDELTINEQVFINAGVETGSLKATGSSSIDGSLAVGPDDAAGELDSGGTGVSPQDLKIGTGIVTEDVEIGRTGKEVYVKGRLDAEEHVRVGTAANDGLIDAADDARDLKIGTQVDYTGDLILSRSGKMTDIMGKTRHNGMQVIINDAATLGAATGCGFMYNSNGHPGPNEPCIDFYVDGTLVGYIDANGWNNA